MRSFRSNRAPLWALLLLVALGLALPREAQAQTGNGTEIITGRVVGPDGVPVAGARVEATSSETETTRGRTTNDKGQFTILFPDGSGQYRVTVRAIGFTPATQSVIRQSDEDRLEINFRLTRATTQLTAVTITGARGPLQSGTDRPTPGTQERVLTGEQLFRLPVDASDPNALAGLAAGVVTLGGTDSTAGAFSVAGQRTDQNQITLDGLSFGTGSVPQEAVRSSRVVTSTYDVARGQFTGGQVASTTRSGTNQVQGSLGYDLREPNLQFPDEESIQFGQRYTQNQLSFGLGGPIKKDKLFIFGSAQWRLRTDGLQSLTSANDAIFQRFGTSPDSADRFLDILGGYGLDARVDAVPSRRLSENLSTLARMDYVLSDRHTASLRTDWRFGVQNATRISALSVPHYGGDLNSLGGGVLASLISQFDNGIINEFRIYGAMDSRDTKAYLQGIPEGRVRVTSELEDGTRGISTLLFGGNGALPQDVENDQLEATNELSWISSGGAHRVKFGAMLNLSSYNQDFATNRNGSFIFNSLSDLEQGRPIQFTRTLAPTERNGGIWNGALYLGDTYRHSRALQLTYGVRLEGTAYDGAPAYNPAVEALFGRRTDRFPTEIHLSPRIGFTWTLGLPDQQPGGAGGQQGGGQGGGAQGRAGGRGAGGAGGGAGGRGGAGGGPGGGGPFAGLATTVIRGGIGEFRGRAPSGLFTGALDATGLAGAESQLVCIGAAVPTPNWTGYLADPSSIPTMCRDGSTGPNTQNQRPNVTTFDSDFGAPRSWRASLGVQKRFWQRYSFNLDVSYALGTHLYGVRDLNLAATPRFALDAEGGRPVFVNPTAIVPATGAVNNLDSRVQSGYGSVFAVGSGLRSDNRQATLSVNGFTSRGILLSASYTYARSRDQSSFSCCSAQQAFASPTTDGDPNATPWGTSDLERRHVIVTTATWPVHPSLELTTVARLTSGQPYTPRVGGDINGDGSRNDRAFVFDPRTTADPLVAAGMTNLLANASGKVRACLEGQMGGIAGRNSCTGPWFPSVDLRMNYRPDRLGLKRNLMISLSLQNPLAGVDRLVNGSELKGWGQPQRVDPNLLYVRGFDAATRSFKYEVNERFGDAAGRSAGGVGARGGAQNLNPFQVALQVRYTIGPDRVRQAMVAAQASVRGGGAAAAAGGAPAGGGEMAGMIRRLAPNTFAQILQLRDTLALDSAQLRSLRVMRDSLDAAIGRLATDVQARLARIGNNADPAAIAGVMREPGEEVQKMQRKALEAAEKVLTAQQWAKVPERIKTVRAGLPFGGQGAAGGPAGRRPD